MTNIEDTLAQVAVAVDQMRPASTDPEWPEYVMSHFVPDELSQEGYPKAAGLRRVCELLVGPLVESDLEVVHSGPLDRTAAVVFRAKILYNQGEFAGSPHHRTFADAADVSPVNTDPEIAKHALATCVTKAEGRVFRKALKLRKPSAEEMSFQGGGHQQQQQQQQTRMIEDSQIVFLQANAQRAGVDLKAFINAGQYSYKDIKEVPYERALLMCEKMSDYVNKPKSVPKELKNNNEQR